MTNVEWYPNPPFSPEIDKGIVESEINTIISCLKNLDPKFGEEMDRQSHGNIKIKGTSVISLERDVTGYFRLEKTDAKETKHLFLKRKGSAGKLALNVEKTKDGESQTIKLISNMGELWEGYKALNMMEIIFPEVFPDNT